MHFFRPSFKSINAPIFLMLVAALLLVQWVGLRHRIVHAGENHGHHALVQMDVSTHQPHGDDDAEHSCVAFDAATLADSIGAVPFLAPLRSDRHTLALWLAFASWDAPFLCHFSSRAPPRG